MSCVTPRRAIISVIAVLGLSLTLVACGPAQQPEGADTMEAEADSSEPGGLPDRDVSNIDVCTELPAEVLAQAVGMSVAETPWRMEEDPAPNCTYRMRSPAGVDERVDVILKDAFDFDWARKTAETFERDIQDLEGIGVAAFMKDTLDGWWEVWARRQDGLVVLTIAREPQPAQAAARVALDEIP